MSKQVITYLIAGIVLLLLQVLLLNNIRMGGSVNPFLYVLFVLMLPFETPGYLLLFSGFFMGLSVDIFSNTLGIHAAATTFVAFIRPAVVNMVSSRDLSEVNALPHLHNMGLARFLKYTVILVVAHHFFLFFVEVFTLNDFIFTLVRAAASAAFTIVLVIISQLLIYRN